MIEPNKWKESKSKHIQAQHDYIFGRSIDGLTLSIITHSCPLISVNCSICKAVLCLVASVRLFAILQTVAHQAPLSMEFSRQEYWSGLPFPSPGDLPDPGIKPASLTSLVLADRKSVV